MSTSETGRRRLPRFERAIHGRLAGGEFVRPIPPTLLALVRETPEAERHETLARRYGEARTKSAGLVEAIPSAKRLDAEAVKKAAEEGKAAPRSKAAKLEEELEGVRLSIASLEESLRESASALLAVAAAHAGKAAESAEQRVEVLLEEAREALALAVERFKQAGEVAGERGWLAQLSTTGIVHVWSGRAAQPARRAATCAREGIVALEHDRAEAAQHRAEAAKQQARTESETLPPGTQVWRGGESFIADEEGGLQKEKR